MAQERDHRCGEDEEPGDRDEVARKSRETEELDRARVSEDVGESHAPDAPERQLEPRRYDDDKRQRGHDRDRGQRRIGGALERILRFAGARLVHRRSLSRLAGGQSPAISALAWPSVKSTVVSWRGETLRVRLSTTGLDIRGRPRADPTTRQPSCQTRTV